MGVVARARMMPEGGAEARWEARVPGRRRKKKKKIKERKKKGKKGVRCVGRKSGEKSL